MKLIDVFLFNDEFRMLENRLEYLYDHVDYFVLVEGDKTFSGHKKPFYFDDNKRRYSKYLNKILNFKFVSDDRIFDLAWDPWQYEVAHRTHISFCLDSFDPDDIILVSDLDEIPNKDKLPQIKNDAHRDDITSLHYNTFCYNLKTKSNSDGLFAAYAAKKRIVLSHGPNRIRKSFGFTDISLKGEVSYNTVNDAGWHLNNFFPAQIIANKIYHSALLEYKTEHFLDAKRIQSCIDDRLDLYERDKQTYSEIDPEKYFPSDFLKIFNT